MKTSTHAVTIGEREVRKEFVADHEAEAEREWECLTLLAAHAPGNGAWHRNPPDTTEAHAEHFMALAAPD